MRVFSIILLWLCTVSLPAADAFTTSMSHRRFTTHDGLPRMQTEVVWQDSRGYIYIGTLSGFVRYDGRSFTPFLRGHRWNVVGFMQDGDDIYALSFRQRWLVSDDRTGDACPLDDEGRWLLNNFNSGDLPNGYVLLEDEQEQHRWVATAGHHRSQTGERTTALHGLSRFFDDERLDLMTPDRRLFIDGGAVYIPTAEGLFCGAKRVSAKPDVYALCRHDSTLYALAADGIYTVSDDSLTLLTPYDDWAADYGLIARTTSDGTLIIADSHSLYSYDGLTVTKRCGGFNLTKSLLIDRWDRLWVATYQGAYCFFNRQFNLHHLNDDDDIVRAVAVSGDVTVMGTLNGKVIVGDSIVYDNSDDYFQPSAAVIDGNVYMAGATDVARVTPDGSISWMGLPYNRYQFVARAGDRLLLGMRRMMVACDPKTGDTDTLTTEIAHPWCAAQDADDNVWVGSTYGLYRLEGHELTQLNSMVVTAMATDSHGNVCFANCDSLYVITGGTIRNLNGDMPQLSGHEIRSLHITQAGHLVVAVTDGLFVARLRQDCHAADVTFFDHRNGFTMMEPLQSTMAEAADGTVFICGTEDMMSLKPEELLGDARHDTVITPPLRWWQHWWAWLAAALLVAALLWAVAYRVAQRRHRRLLQRIEREKKQKELQLQTIRLKSIPHFHANVLASIEYFVMNSSSDEAARYLKIYSDFTNQTLADISLPARTLREEIDYVRSYLQLEQLRYGERLNFDIVTHGDVDMLIRVPTMMLHTYCENAVKHGISNKPTGGNVTVTVRGVTQAVEITVTDNGVGRAQAARLSTNQSTKQGLTILGEQIRLYNLHNRHHITQDVSDLFDADGKPAGTSYKIVIPTDYTFE